MRDSDTYMHILEEGQKSGFKKGRRQGLEEGRVEELHKLIIKIGDKRLGKPNKRVTATITSITDVERLESLAGNLLEVSSWQELLAI